LEHFNESPKETESERQRANKIRHWPEKS